MGRKYIQFSTKSWNLVEWQLSSSWQVYLVDAKGNGFYREGKIVGYDPAYDLAVLKVRSSLPFSLLS